MTQLQPAGPPRNRRVIARHVRRAGPTYRLLRRSRLARRGHAAGLVRTVPGITRSAGHPFGQVGRDNGSTPLTL
jgi:hypothetical protein